MKTAVYAGSFDPVTNGHLWMIEKSAMVFDKVIVAIGDNYKKNYSFSTKDRIEMLKTLTSHIENVEITSFRHEFLVNYAKKVGAGFIVRGVRNATDYEYEKSMRYINSDLCDEISTVFFMPPRNFAEVSSSMVKGFIGSDGWEEIAAKYVPAPVLNKMVEMVNHKQN